MRLKTPYRFVLFFTGIAVLVCLALVGARAFVYFNGEIDSDAIQQGLIVATVNDDVVAMGVLLALGAQTDPPISAMNTRDRPLCRAVGANAPRAVRLLLACGANPDGGKIIYPNFQQYHYDFDDRPGEILYTFRPLFLAARGRKTEIAKILIENGAKYEFIDALLLADELTVRETLKSKSFDDLFGFYGKDILPLLIEARNVPAIRLMLDVVLEPDESRRFAESSLEQAERTGRDDIVALLKSYIDKEPAA